MRLRVKILTRLVAVQREGRESGLARWRAVGGVQREPAAEPERGEPAAEPERGGSAEGHGEVRPRRREPDEC